MVTILLTRESVFLVHRQLEGQYEAVFHHFQGRNCGRPFTWLISPNVTKPGAAQTAR